MTSLPRIGLLTLLVGLALPTALIGKPRTIVVSPGGPVSRIADAVKMAAPGDSIRISSGTYREDDILVDRPVVILGSGDPIVLGSGDHTLITVTADHVEIRGLVLRNVATSFVEDRAGIKVDGGQHCVIADNTLEDTFFGIYLARAANCRVERNRLRANKGTESRSGNGIHLWYSKDVSIVDNRIEGHRDGIYLEFVEDSRINANESTLNHRYGLHFMFSDRCSYRSNLLTHNDAGVAVMYTKNVVMEDNTFSDNWGNSSYGLLLKDITDSRVVGNRFVNNTIGIYAEGSNRIEIEKNTFERNGWAVKVMANSESNTFRLNNFIGNSFDVATNSRQSNSHFDGNYWDQYEGYDLDRDGIGDVPFRPVRLFSLIIERNAPAMVLMRSFFVDLLDAAERVFPVLTPEALVDSHPKMKIIS